MKSSDLKLVNVTKKFPSHDGKGELTAVDSINLDIHEGELTTLLGPSGCGKTTTLRMVAGFENTTSGEILLGGEAIENTPPNKRDMAMMFQSYALFPHMTIYDNIAYGLKIKKLPKDEIKRRTEKVIELMQIKGMEDRVPAQVSGGQQQRVALARAVVTEPKVLLFDEPLSNLDAKLREYMRDELRSLQQRLGITSLYVTHDQSEAMAISDKVVLMNKGKIAQLGSPKDLYENPNSKFVANFIGKSNFVDCKIIENKEKNAIIEVLGKNLTIPNPGQPIINIKDKSVIVVRPEAITLADKGEGMFNGVVEKAVFYGTNIEYVLKVQDVKLIMELYRPQVQKVYEVGESIGVNFDLECIRVLPDEEE